MDFRETLCAVFAGAFLFHGAAHAAEPGLRLIETGPGQRSWMTESEISALSRAIHEKGKCGGFFDVTDAPDEVAAPMAFVGGLENRRVTRQSIVEPMLAQLTAARLMDHVKTLSSFKNRYYNSNVGASSAQWIKDRFTAIARNRTDITVEEVKHAFLQPSIIARIVGTGPLAAERVILGAHQDSISRSGSGDDMVAPGADDDASGISTVLEAFRVVVESGYRPTRTLEFMAYAGEEAGLLGSQDIARRYKAAKVPVFAMAQFDMTMYPGKSTSMTMIQDYTHSGLNQFAGLLIDTYVKAVWGRDECGYGCSDHASWNRNGYPSTMPFEAPMGEDNPGIHSTRDVMSVLDSSFGLHFAKLAVSLAVELSSGP